MFRDTGTLPGEDARALLHGDRGLRPARRRAARPGPATTAPSGPGACARRRDRPEPMPKECDDGPFGRGTGGQLRYRVKLRGHDSQTLWIAVAGSDNSVGEARSEFSRLPKRPERQLAEKAASRRALARHSRIELPGDPAAAAVDRRGASRTSPISPRRRPTSTSAGPTRARSGPTSGSLRRMTWVGAGFPDYPWLFGTDGEYTAHASVVARPVRVDRGRTCARCATSPTSSATAPASSCTRSSPTARSGTARTSARRPGRHHHVQVQHRRDRQVPVGRRARVALDGRRRLPRRDARLHPPQPGVRAHAARRGRRRLARGQRQRRAARHGRGEARQRRLLHPRALRLRRHGAVGGAGG